MKILTAVLGIFLLSAGFAAAQDMTGFVAKDHLGPGIAPADAKAPPNPNVVLKPKLGGIFVDGAKFGWVMISPGAPSSYGLGEKYLSAPDSRFDLQHESGNAAHRDTGGFKLFTLEF